MSSSKKVHSSIFIAFVLLLVSCSPDSNDMPEFKRINLKTNPLFHYSNIGTLNEAPVCFIETWNRPALKKMGVHRITLFTKGGKNPDDTLERITFDYSNKWRTLTYEGFQFAESPEAWTSGVVSIPDHNQTGQIVFTRHFGIQKQQKTLVQPLEDGYLLLRSKSGNRYDSTWVMGTLNEPEAVIVKIGKSIFSVELYVPEGSSTKDIIRHFEQLPLSGSSQTAQYSVVFTRVGKPRSAFLLNEVFSQVAHIKEWTYTADGNIATYQEWTGTTLTKDMSWHYPNRSQLPDYTVIDRNTYFYRYE